MAIMSHFTEKELRGHEIVAWGLLVVAVALWSLARWARHADVGIEEYEMCAIGGAAVIASVAAAIRASAWLKRLLARTDEPRAPASVSSLALSVVFYAAALALVSVEILYPWYKHLRS